MSAKLLRLAMDIKHQALEIAVVGEMCYRNHFMRIGKRQSEWQILFAHFFRLLNN